MTKYSINQQEFEYNIENKQIIQKVNLADIQTKDLDVLALIENPGDNYLSVTLTIDQDYLKMTSNLPMNCQGITNLRKACDSEKIRCLLNLVQIKDIIYSPIGTFLHPQNIILDYNNRQKFIYRGLKKYMPFQKITTEYLVEFIQLCAGILYTKYRFEELSAGMLDKVARKNTFLEKIRAIKTLDKLEDYLEKALHEAYEREQRNNKIIKRKTYIIWQQSAIWLGVLLALSVVPLAIFSFKIIPNQHQFLQADTDYIQMKYDSVIKDLEQVPLKDLPKSQKYELAVSYVEGSGFVNTQRNNIMHNLNLRSKEEYLDFWIEMVEVISNKD